jgi:tRNA 5-methylaminomethyl-2-thiouridine biosynthesis bifunctional protein
MNPLPSADTGWDGDTLVSHRFADVYASRSGALAQARAVFLAGCGLPDRWQARRRFTVAELGFGTGLNMLATLQAWGATRPAGATLHLFSVEAYPLDPADVARALAAFPELAPLTAPLLARWPVARGVTRLAWPDLAATLDVATMDAAEALAGWQGRADAWFLDGFSPARNPAMWHPDLLAQVAARSAPGARAATWSVASGVREALEAAGFAVSRAPGLPPKRHRLEARLPGCATDADTTTVAVLGDGIAGASLAAALRALAVPFRQFASGPAASANPAALVSPRLAAGSSSAAMLHAQAYAHAVAAITATAPQAILARGLIRHLLRPEDSARAAATVASALFTPGTLALEGQALHIADALTVDPAALRAAWNGPVEPLAVTALSHDGQGWWLESEGSRTGPFTAACLAAGAGLATLSNLPLRPVRGQVSLAAELLSGPPQSWGGYLIPTASGLLFGATHDRNDQDWAPREADQQRNLETLARVAPDLAARLSTRTLGAVAGVRAAAPDHQPVAGPLAPGLFVLGGLGGRGFTLAPLLAAHIAALIAGTPSPLMAPLTRLVDPARLLRGAAASAGGQENRSAAAPAAAARDLAV